MKRDENSVLVSLITKKKLCRKIMEANKDKNNIQR